MKPRLTNPLSKLWPFYQEVFKIKLTNSKPAIFQNVACRRGSFFSNYELENICLEFDNFFQLGSNWIFYQCWHWDKWCNWACSRNRNGEISQCGNFMILREIKVDKVRVSKYAIFIHWEALNVAIYEFWHFFGGWNVPN